MNSPNRLGLSNPFARACDRAAALIPYGTTLRSMSSLTSCSGRLKLLKTEALNNLCFTDVPIILTAKALLIKFEAIGEDDVIVNFPV